MSIAERIVGRRAVGGMLTGVAIACFFGFAVPASVAAAPRSARARRVTVIATEYKFTPSHLVFRRGVAYRLRLDNRGKETHEFTAPAFFKAATLRNPQALDADRTQLTVAPGEHKDLYFTPRRAGNFPLTCADHDWAGMTGDITVR